VPFLVYVSPYVEVLKPMVVCGNTYNIHSTGNIDSHHPVLCLVSICAIIACLTLCERWPAVSAIWALCLQGHENPDAVQPTLYCKYSRPPLSMHAGQERHHVSRVERADHLSGVCACIACIFTSLMYRTHGSSHTCCRKGHVNKPQHNNLYETYSLVHTMAA
jgi:hypothetical protein